MIPHDEADWSAWPARHPLSPHHEVSQCPMPERHPSREWHGGQYSALSTRRYRVWSAAALSLLQSFRRDETSLDRPLQPAPVPSTRSNAKLAFAARSILRRQDVLPWERCASNLDD